MNPLLRRLRSLLITDGLGDTDRIETVITAAVRGGVRAVQLREHGLQARQLQHLCQRLWPLIDDHDGLLLVNDRVDVAALQCVHGVHLGFRSLSPAAARQILGPGKLIGFSAHDERELSWASEQGADYAVLAPVLATSSKPGAQPLGVERSRGLVAAASLPVILLGGVDQRTAPGLRDVGAHGYAFMSAVFQSDDPELAARQLLEVIR